MVQMVQPSVGGALKCARSAEIAQPIICRNRPEIIPRLYAAQMGIEPAIKRSPDGRLYRLYQHKSRGHPYGHAQSSLRQLDPTDVPSPYPSRSFLAYPSFHRWPPLTVSLSSVPCRPPSDWTRVPCEPGLTSAAHSKAQRLSNVWSTCGAGRA